MRHVAAKTVHAGVLVILASLLVASCGKDDPEPTAQLPCEEQGYPCEPADVSDEVAHRGILLTLIVQDKRINGTPADAEAWLREQPGLVEVARDKGAIAFRQEEDIWRYALPDPEVSMSPMSMDAPSDEETARQEFVVGDQAKTKREEKYALVLDVLLAEKGMGDSQVVPDILESTRGYDGRIDVHTDEAVTLAKLQAFGNYDVVHLSTHGACVQDAGPYQCLVESGQVGATAQWPSGDLEPGVVPEGPVLEDFEAKFPDVTRAIRQARNAAVQASSVGVSPSLRQVCQSFGNCDVVVRLAVEPSFFQTSYPSGVKNTFIFFNGCQTLDLATEGQYSKALTGTAESSFMGWTDKVGDAHAISAAQDLYTEASEHGRSIDDIYLEWDALSPNVPGARRYQRAPRSAGDPAVDAVLKTHATVGSQRIREVVTLLNGTDELLDGVDATRLMDGYTGDDRPDRLNLQVRLEGVEEGLAQTYRIYFELDGQRVGRAVKAAEMDKVDDYLYEVDVDGLELGVDLKKSETYDLTAVAELPDQGESVHHVEDLGFIRECNVGPYFAEFQDGELIAPLHGACSPLNDMVEDETTYLLCMCGERPLEDGGTINHCDILCEEDDASQNCHPGEDGDWPPPGYLDSSQCYDMFDVPTRDGVDL